MPTMKWIRVEVRFFAAVPDGDLEADEWADEMSDKITAAVQAIPGVAAGSVDVPDWTEERE